MIYPSKLSLGSHIRIIAPSRSFKIISEETRSIAKKRFEDMKITVSYSKHCDEIDDFVSSSVEARLEDLHEAFSDKSVDGILTAIGGFNTNQLIDKIDYNLIKSNPKILCGFSDITCLCMFPDKGDKTFPNKLEGGALIDQEYKRNLGV